MEAFSSANDLLRVHSTESGVRLVVHGWSSDTERNDSSVDESVVLEVPYIIQISSFGIWVDSKAQNSVSVIEAHSLIKSQELEISARSLVLVNASLISIKFSLELSRSVIEVLIITSDGLSSCGLLREVSGRFTFSKIFSIILIGESYWVEHSGVLFLLSQSSVHAEITGNS